MLLAVLLQQYSTYLSDGSGCSGIYFQIQNIKNSEDSILTLCDGKKIMLLECCNDAEIGEKIDCEG